MLNCQLTGKKSFKLTRRGRIRVNMGNCLCCVISFWILHYCFWSLISYNNVLQLLCQVVKFEQQVSVFCNWTLPVVNSRVEGECTFVIQNSFLFCRRKNNNDSWAVLFLNDCPVLHTPMCPLICVVMILNMK